MEGKDYPVSRTFYVNITYGCNSRCVFCASEKTNYGTRQPEALPVREFIKFLESAGAGPKDHVMLNGGEPTIHKDFFQFIGAVNEKQAQLTVFTNGRRMADHEFSQHLAEFAPLEILVPIYSMEAHIHDGFTGIRGSLLQTLQGVANLFEMQAVGKDLMIEFRLLVSRYTGAYTIDTVRTLSRIYRSRRFTFSINPLIVSKKARIGGHATPLSELIPTFRQLIEEIRATGRRPLLGNIPKCILWQIRPELAMEGGSSRRATTNEIYLDSYIREESRSNTKLFAAACNSCIPHPACLSSDIAFFTS